MSLPVAVLTAVPAAELDKDQKLVRLAGTSLQHQGRCVQSELGPPSWLWLLQRLESPRDSAVIGVFGLLAVGVATLVARDNVTGKALALFGNFALAVFWTWGLIQRAPGIISVLFSSELDSRTSVAVAVVIVSSFSVIIPCLVNAVCIPKLAQNRHDNATDDNITVDA